MVQVHHGAMVVIWHPVIAHKAAQNSVLDCGKEKKINVMKPSLVFVRLRAAHMSGKKQSILHSKSKLEDFFWLLLDGRCNQNPSISVFLKPPSSLKMIFKQYIASYMHYKLFISIQPYMLGWDFLRLQQFWFRFSSHTSLFGFKLTRR